MELEIVLRRRRMVRNFENRPLPRAVVERLLANAQRGPSAGFSQGVELLVLEGPEQTARYWDISLPLADRARFHWPGLLRAPLLILPFAHEQTYLDRYAESDKRPLQSRHAGGAEWNVPYWIVDSSFAALLVLLTAVDEGLGALFFRVHRPAAVRQAFGVPAGYEPIGVIAAGYPAPDVPSSSLRRGRRPAAEVVHRGHW